MWTNNIRKQFYINILDFEIDEVFIPTIYIENAEHRSLINDAFSNTGIAVTMEKTNIEFVVNTDYDNNLYGVKYNTGVVDEYAINYTLLKLSPHDLLLYAIGKKIDCAKRDAYVLNITNNVKCINDLFKQLKTKCNEITQITEINNLFKNYPSAPFSKIIFNIPDIFKPVNNTSNDSNASDTNHGLKIIPFIPFSQMYGHINTKRSTEPTEDKLKSEFNVIPYNVLPYNVLNSSNLTPFKFNDSGTHILDTLLSKPVNTPTYYIYVNTHTFSTFVSTKNNFIKVFDIYVEYGFQLLTSYTTNNNDIVQFIQTMFNKKTFENKEEIESKLLTTEKYIKFCEETMLKQNETSEYDIVKNYVNHLYEIVTNNSDHKLKATEIFEIFEKKQEYLGLKVDTNFRNRLSKYLIDMGLQKKRFSDGYYYFGLIQRK